MKGRRLNYSSHCSNGVQGYFAALGVVINATAHSDSKMRSWKLQLGMLPLNYCDLL